MYRLAFATALLTILLLAGCSLSTATRLPKATLAPTPTLAQYETDIPFETIVLEPEGNYYDGTVGFTGSQLLLLTRPEQLTVLEDKVSPEAMTKLRQVDFDKHSVIALFRGVMPTNNYHTVIDRIAYRGDHLWVHAQFFLPRTGSIVTPAYTSPYHLVKIPRLSSPLPVTPELVLQPIFLTPEAPFLPGESPLVR